MLARAYECPSCLDLKQLCVVEGKQCWVIYVDVLVGVLVFLNQDSNLNNFIETVKTKVSSFYMISIDNIVLSALCVSKVAIPEVVV